MTESTEAMRELVIGGARLLMRIYGLGLPTIAACTGHALAAGALVLLSCDRRIGADGAAKIGLNEVAIGMALPMFAVELARERLQPSHFTAATMGAQVYDPAGAVTAGYLDAVAPEFDLLTTALAEARALGELRSGAYGRTKSVARAASIDAILASLEDDIASISGPEPG
jgi:enoyl-CoA hydratase